MPEPIPFIDLKPYVQHVLRAQGDDGTALEREITGGFERDFNKLLDSCEFIGGGRTTQKLEGALAATLGAPHVVVCANGTDALQLALRAAGIDRGSRVAIPNLTFWATYEAVVNVGATPIILDIDPDDLQLSYDEFIRAHNKHLFDAVVLVHLYGWCSKRLADFRMTCRNRRITLVEDGAQAFSVEVDGQSIFADADLATLSFHPAKVIGGIGDGGAILCKSARTAARARLLANHGRLDHYQHIVAGWNSRMDTMQAAWLLRALEVWHTVVEQRRLAFSRYDLGLHGAHYCPPNVKSNGYIDVRFVQNRDEIRRRLRTAGIETGCAYPASIIDQDGAHGAPSVGALDVSRRLARMTINLPLFFGITDEQQDRVLEAASGVRL